MRRTGTKTASVNNLTVDTAGLVPDIQQQWRLAQQQGQELP